MESPLPLSQAKFSQLHSWSAGRTLTSFTLNNGASYVNGSYIYNDEGIRVYKNINGNETEYYLNGSLIQTEITNFGGVTRRVDYIYDENDSIYGFSVDGVDYYYVKNLQGDIIGILDKTGNLLVEYIYDAYGVPTVSFPGITEDMSEAEKQAIYLLGNNNPFRYRGYYFDVESGLYYLNSRYYDPVTGRFINADKLLDKGSTLGFNLFAYCANNPINKADAWGNCHYDVKNGFVCDYDDAQYLNCNACYDPYNCPVCYRKIQYNLCYERYVEEAAGIAERWNQCVSDTYNTIAQKREEILEKKKIYIKDEPYFIMLEVLYHSLGVLSAYKTLIKGAAWIVPKTAKGVYKVVTKTVEAGINLYNFKELLEKIKDLAEEVIEIFEE